jgi:hypothetical protein
MDLKCLLKFEKLLKPLSKQISATGLSDSASNLQACPTRTSIRKREKVFLILDLK